jgi:hypothetical protein
MLFLPDTAVAVAVGASDVDPDGWHDRAVARSPDAQVVTFDEIHHWPEPMAVATRPQDWAEPARSILWPAERWR